MRAVPTYVHALPGRLRIGVAEVKASPDAAAEVAARIRTLGGIRDARANPVTGNVLVLFDDERTDAEQIIEALETWGYLRVVRQPVVSYRPELAPEMHWGATILQITTRVALERLLTRLI